MATERYFKVNDKIPKKPEGPTPGRPPKDTEVLKGRSIDIKWQEGWYRGTVTQWNPHTGLHTIEYDDGTLCKYKMRRKLWRGATAVAGGRS